MSRQVLLMGVLALLAASCGGGGSVDSSTTAVPVATTVTTRGETSPAEAVAFWVDTLAIGSFSSADLVVEDAQVVLLIAVESYSPEVFEQLSREGAAPEVRAAFWSSFVGGFEAFTGAGITDIAVGGERWFEASGRSFAEVELLSSRGEASVIAIEEDGRWYVDVLATFGPSFSSLFNLWVDRLPPEAQAPRAALSEQSVSLTVARDRLDPEIDSDAVAALNDLLSKL